MKKTFIICLLILIITLTVVLLVKTQSSKSNSTGNNSTGNNSTESLAGNSTEQTNVVDGEGYYWDNSQEVMEIIDVKQSNDIPSESEVIKVLEERGFADCTATYQFDLNGEYYEETELTGNSSEKHPMYLAYYMNERGEWWTIHIINGKVFAYPASYNLDSDLQVEVIVSETSKITSYDCETNKFYVTIPKEQVVKVITVDRIDAATLDELTIEEISNYEN